MSLNKRAPFWQHRQPLVCRLESDESGQGTMEYVLILAVVVSIFMAVFKTWIGPAYAKLIAAATTNMQSQLMGADLHYFRVSR